MSGDHPAAGRAAAAMPEDKANVPSAHGPAVAILGALAVVGYFAQQFAPIFQWPDWVTNISLYALYGTPMSKDDWGGIATLIGIGLAGTAVAIVAMRRRDVGR